jgi:transposase
MMRDELGTLFTDADFAALVPTRGQPAAAPWRLALVTIRPYVEEVSDRPAAEAVRGRIDGKYALSLELTDPGFDRTVFSEFRTRVVVGSAEQRRLDAIRARCRERKWLKARGRQRPDSTHVLACVRAVKRVEGVGETLRQTLNRLAVVAPEWLHTPGQVEWGER